MNAEAVVTVASILFGLFHLGRAAVERLRAWAPVEVAEDVAAAPDYGAYLDEEPADDALGLDELCHFLNDCPDHLPHLAVYGPSGSGKSTFVLALLKRRPGQLVITTPKNAADDPWGGFPAVRLGFTRDEDGDIEPDWGAIRDAIRAVRQEVMARHADGSRPRTPLTLVVDELTTTINAVGKQAMIPWMIDIWLTARSVGVRLIVMDPTANVEGWGLTGRGDVRDSIGFVRCERDKSAMLGELDECRRADATPLDTSDIPAAAAGSLDPSRVWVPLSRPAMHSAISRPSAAHSGATIRLPDSNSAWEDKVRDLAEQGLSTRKILAALGGNYNEIVRLAREVRQEAS